MKAVLKLLLLSVLLCGAIACQDGDDKVANGEFTITEGETRTLINDGKITFTKENDSRCPFSQGDCIWEGRAEVEIVIEENGKEKLVIALNDVEKKLVETTDYTIEFIDLSPYPGTPEDEADEPHMLKVSVTKKD